MLIDTHAHLCDDKLTDSRDAIIASLSNNGVGIVVEIGADVRSSAEAVVLANQYDNIYASVGMHPQEADAFILDDIAKIKELALSSAKVRAIGEVGLDYHYDYDRVRQQTLFVEQLLLADELKLPIIIHLRDAYEDMYKLLVEHRDRLTNGVLLHCYSGSKEMIRQLAFLDAYYAFGGAITFKNNNRADVIRAVKRDRILLETDCPYMSPTPYRGQINSPLNLKIIAERMAVDLDISLEELTTITTDNAKRFYRI